MQVGIDEVGRGCVAGPVVACAVILPPDYLNSEIKDSKKLSAKKREMLTIDIKKNALAIGTGVVCSRLIDKIGIVPATKQAMQIALSQINIKYNSVVVDAVKLNNMECSIINPFKAEDHYQSVAAASIVAKVYRDELMDYLDTVYNVYNWKGNKGYGTAAHMDAIRIHGITSLHRKTFLQKYI